MGIDRTQSLPNVLAEMAQGTSGTTPAQAPSLQGLSPSQNEPPLSGGGSHVSHPAIGQEPTRVDISGVRASTQPTLGQTLGCPVLHGETADYACVVAESLSAANMLLGNAPAGAGEAAALKQACDDQMAILTGLKNSMGPDVTRLFPDLGQELQYAITELGDRKEYLDVFCNTDPTTRKAIAETRQTWAEAALDWLHENLDQSSPVVLEAEQLLAQHVAELGQVQDTSPLVVGGGGSDGVGGGAAAAGSLESRYATGLKELMGDKKASGNALRDATAAFKQSVRDGHIETSSVLTEQKAMEILLADVCKRVGADASHVKHGLMHAHQHLLGDRMHAFRKDIPVQTPDGTRHFSSEMVPAKEFATNLQHDFGHGVACHQSQEGQHAKNLWTSALTTSDGRTLFKGLRHGIHSAYGFAIKEVQGQPRAETAAKIKELLPESQWVRKNGAPNLEATVSAVRSRFSITGHRLRDAMRTTANVNRAREALTAGLVSNPKILQEALAGGNPRLAYTSVALVSPDLARGALGKFGFWTANNERRMISDQVQALRTAAAEGLHVTARNAEGQEVRLHIPVDLRTFDFGVNATTYNPVYKRLTPSVGFANEVANNGAMASLIGTGTEGAFGGDVGAFLARTDVDAQTRSEVRELATQVRTMWNEGSYRQDKGDGYAMPTRLAVLADRMGQAVAWNCKSGKDRTGELDAEAKFLAIRMELTGQVPVPGPLSPADQALFRTVALSAGNLELQRMNTGSGGYKLEGVDSITERLGGMQAKLTHRGQSKFTAS